MTKCSNNFLKYGKKKIIVIVLNLKIFFTVLQFSCFFMNPYTIKWVSKEDKLSVVIILNLWLAYTQGIHELI